MAIFYWWPRRYALAGVDVSYTWENKLMIICMTPPDLLDTFRPSTDAESSIDLREVAPSHRRS
jgi:hypothetical protein